MVQRRAFGSVRKLPSGRFQASYTAPDGTRRTAPDTFPSRTTADTWLATVRTDLARGGWHDPDLGRQTVREYALTWLEQREMRARTLESYASMLDRKILPRLGDVRLSDLSPAMVRQWYATLDAPAPTKAKAYRVLRAVLNTAVEDGAITANPCRIPGAGQDVHTERQPPTLAEVARIVDATPDRWRVMVMVAAFGGLRLGELLGLQRQDISLDPLTVTVRRNMQFVAGSWVSGDPKTAAGRRTVALPPHLALDVASHLETYVSDDPDALVFATSAGTPPHRSNWTRTFKRTCREAIGRDDLHFHDMRHAAAVLAAQMGATTKDVMSRLGHASPRAALIYQHAASERDAQIAEAMSAAVASGSVPLRSVG